MQRDLRDWIEAELEALHEDQVITSRVRRFLDRLQETNDQKINAYETLLRLSNDPTADSSYLEEMLEKLGITVDEPDGNGDQEQTDGEASESRPAGDDSLGATVVSEEFIPYVNCETIPEVVETLADLQNGAVSVARAAAIVMAVGLAKSTWQNPKDRSWTIVYNMLKESERYQYCGRGTARFRRVRPADTLGEA